MSKKHTEENLQKIELHDALLDKMDIDYVKKTVRISLSFYENEQLGDRRPAIIDFKGVESIAQTCDLHWLKQYEFSGNISYWHPRGADTTYIFLSDGCLAIKARKIKFRIR
jgi:hypothetical protein